MDLDQEAKGVPLMSEVVNDLLQAVQKESESRSQALQQLWSAANVSNVFGQPVTSGEYTVIPAAEVAGGGGFGSGMGFGTPRAHRGESGTGSGDGTTAEMEGAGGGGGGGGGSMGRPVAVITVGPDGVEIKPVLDLTKLAITAVGALGAATAVSLRLLAKRKR
jgi:uncharacterized spore protein YtfJ